MLSPFSFFKLFHTETGSSIKTQSGFASRNASSNVLLPAPMLPSMLIRTGLMRLLLLLLLLLFWLLLLVVVVLLWWWWCVVVLLLADSNKIE